MEFVKTLFDGLFVIKTNVSKDNRGYFMRSYCKNEFKSAGINCDFMQENISFNAKINTVRGMHFQKEPYAEDKLVRCISGGIFDVVVDIRQNSPTFLKWFGIELTEENATALFIPKGFAHGFQTLQDNSAIYYCISQEYNQQSTDGILYNDKKINIKWKNIDSKMIISDKDLSWRQL